MFTLSGTVDDGFRDLGEQEPGGDCPIISRTIRLPGCMVIITCKAAGCLAHDTTRRGPGKGDRVGSVRSTYLQVARNYGVSKTVRHAACRVRTRDPHELGDSSKPRMSRLDNDHQPSLEPKPLASPIIVFQTRLQSGGRMQVAMLEPRYHSRDIANSCVY